MRANLSSQVPRYQWWIIGVAVGAILVVVGVRWWPSSTSGPQPSPPSPPPAPVATASPGADLPFLKVEGSQLTGADDVGRKQWELHAKTLQVDQEKNIVTLTELTGQLYKAGVARLAFMAPRGVLSVKARDVELSGGVTARTTDGVVLHAPQLRWDATHQQLIATGGITITQPGMIIHADQVTADATLHQTTFVGNIRVTVTQ